MHAGFGASKWARSIGALVLLAAMFALWPMGPFPVAAAQNGDAQTVPDGSPQADPRENEASTSDVLDDDALPGDEPDRPAVSLVEPSLLTVSTLAAANNDPCRSIDADWAGVLVRPAFDLEWTDPATGLGGDLQLDDGATAPAFGWDGFRGGSVGGVVVPDAEDAAGTLAHFYDYRPYLGAISGDAGLGAPGGILSVAYLCVPAPSDTLRAPIEFATESPVLLPTETPAGEDSSGSPVAPAPEDIAVRPAAIGIGSSVNVTEPLNLRVEPGLAATVRAVLDAGTVASVIGGPRNASGYTWWQLSTSSGTGWSVVDYLAEQPVSISPTPSATPTRTPTKTSGGAIAIGSTVRVQQRLNLRSLPGTGAAVITVMPAGMTGTVLAGPQSANGYQWWQISTSLGTGWAAGSYLGAIPGTTPVASSTTTSTPADAGSIGIGDLVRVTTRLNLRAGPGTAVITVLPGGSQWPVVDGPQPAGGATWWKVDTSSGLGWVSGQYLARVGVAPTATITRTATVSPTASLTRTPSLTPTITTTPTITSTPAKCGSFGYGDIVRTTDALNFRSQPSTSGAIIRTLAAGERGSVRGGPVTANGYTWCEIQVGSITGWVASTYLARVSGPLPTPNGTVTPRPNPPTPSGGSASVVYQGSSSSGKIALTYDAGTDRGYATTILDALAQYGAHATFGMTGTWARDNPDLVQRMVNEGHQLINHTWDHPSFTGGSTSTIVSTRSGRLSQLDRAEAIVQQTAGYQMSPYWRPPYGDIDASVLSDVYAGGYYITVMWSCDTLGWNGATVQQILNRCMYPSGAGSIILMHLASDSLDGKATGDMIRYFQSKGLQLVTVEELLAG